MATMADGRILIADDEDGLRWVLEKGLRQAGHEGPFRGADVRDGVCVSHAPALTIQPPRMPR